MRNRVNASIVIGGRIAANRINALCNAIADEGLGPDWDGAFESHDELLAYLRSGIDGVDLYGTTVSDGEFMILQAFCATHGLAYRLTYNGCGAQWRPTTRLLHADGTVETCSLDRDGGRACVSRDDLAVLGFNSLKVLHAYLERFDLYRPGPLMIEDAALAAA